MLKKVPKNLIRLCNVTSLKPKNNKKIKTEIMVGV